MARAKPALARSRSRPPGPRSFGAGHRARPRPLRRRAPRGTAGARHRSRPRRLRPLQAGPQMPRRLPARTQRASARAIGSAVHGDSPGPARPLRRSPAARALGARAPGGGPGAGRRAAARRPPRRGRHGRALPRGRQARHARPPVRGGRAQATAARPPAPPSRPPGRPGRDSRLQAPAPVRRPPPRPRRPARAESLCCQGLRGNRRDRSRAGLARAAQNSPRAGVLGPAPGARLRVAGGRAPERPRRPARADGR